ncbi:MAG TPA: FAD-dependent oxidoreductase [Dissulfurispiraceae bacterium]
MDKYDIIIIGAGISGLSLAHYCAKKRLKTMVIEKDARSGGTLHSYRFESASGFWLEMGAHTCYNSYVNLIEVMQESGALGRLIPREKVSFKMLVDGKIKSIPSQLNFPELLLSLPRAFTLRKEGMSVESYYSGLIGRKNFKRVLGPAINAVISQDAGDFPAELLFKKRSRRKDVMKKFTLAGGVQTIADAIAAQKNISFAHGQAVLAISRGNGLFEVTTAKDSYAAQHLALATPASVAARLLRDSFPGVAEKLSGIRVETIGSVGVAVRKDLVPAIPQAAGIIPVSDAFHSIVTRDTVKHDEYRGFTFHFKPGLMDLEDKLTRVSAVLGVERRQLERVTAKENCIPSLRVGHPALVRALDQAVSGTSLLLTGNYFDGLAIEDCVTRSRKEFERCFAPPTGG